METYVDISPFQSTIISCSRCGTVEANRYEIRRMGSKYILLCRFEDGGCAAKEILPQCQFITLEGVQCEQPASHYLSPSHIDDPEAVGNKHSCIRHIGALIGDYPNQLLGQHR